MFTMHVSIDFFGIKFYTSDMNEFNNHEELLAHCIRHGRMGAAAMLARELEKSESMTTLFNIGLLCSMAGESAKALEFFDRAIAAHKKSFSGALTPRPSNYEKLRAMDAAADPRPLDADYAAAFPELAREDILIAAAKTATAAGLRDKAAAYLQPLRGAEYQELKK